MKHWSVNKTWDDLTKCWRISVTSDFPFFYGGVSLISIDIPMFIGVQTTFYTVRILRKFMIPPGSSRWYLATSRKMPKLATSSHSIYIITYREIESDKLNLVCIYILYIYIISYYDILYYIIFYFIIFYYIILYIILYYITLYYIILY